MTAPAIYPAATVRLLPEADTQPKIVPRCVIVHSQAGRGSLYGWWLSPESNGLECHFWVSETGKVEQYMPTTIRADANGQANGYAISIETESSPEATERWTPAQAAALTDLIAWCCTTHRIPAAEMATPTGSGVAWHVQFGAPGPWTKVKGKTCPGPARIPQLRREIIPAVAARLAAPPAKPTPPPAPPKGPLMALTDKEQTELLERVRRIDSSTRDLPARLETIYGSLRGWVYAVAEKVGATRDRAVALDPTNKPK